MAKLFIYIILAILFFYPTFKGAKLLQDWFPDLSIGIASLISFTCIFFGSVLTFILVAGYFGGKRLAKEMEEQKNKI